MAKQKYYTYDCEKNNDDPVTFVKWCRRNFGDRGIGWDFCGSGRTKIQLVIWDEKIETMYLMWKT